MPRFYFHLFDDLACIDQEGAEHPDGAAALRKATFVAREMAAECVRGGHLDLDHRVEIMDEHGQTIGVVRFEDVVEVRHSGLTS